MRLTWHVRDVRSVPPAAYGQQIEIGVEIMTNQRSIPIKFLAVLSVTALAVLCGTAGAQKVQGVINGRSGSTMTLQTQDSGNVVVALTPNTQVEEVEGLLKARSGVPDLLCRWMS